MTNLYGRLLCTPMCGMPGTETNNQPRVTNDYQLFGG